MSLAAILTVLAAPAVVAPLIIAAAEPVEYDLVFRNARVVDGTGNPWYWGEVAVEKGTIARIGRPRLPGGLRARRTVDAGGAVLCPGFIDAHSHSDERLLRDGSAPSKIRQGVTTEILGESHSPGPFSDRFPHRASSAGEPTWRTLGGFFRALEERGVAVNVASYVGSGQVWECVMGESEEAPSGEELQAMERLVGEAMEEGALGLSSSLLTRSGRLQTTEHLVRLARAAARHQGLYAVHIRTEGEGIEAALDEVFDIGRRAGLPVEVFHLKLADRRLWGGMAAIGKRIEEARASGVEVTANQYPYTAGMNDLQVMLPPWALSGGRKAMLERLRDTSARERMKRDMQEGLPGWYSHYRAIGTWKGVVVSFTRGGKNRAYEGQPFERVIAERAGKDPFDVLFDFLLEEEGSVPACFFHMSEEDVRTALRFPWVSIGSDGSAASPEGPLSGGSPHPRWYGTFPRILGRYVRELGVISLEEAVRKMTWASAAKLGLRGRGLLAEGMAADLVVLDPSRVADRATFEDPHRFPEGILHVAVNGELVVDGERITAARPGRVLRRKDPRRGGGSRPQRSSRTGGSSSAGAGRAHPCKGRWQGQRQPGRR